mmetsp:Transcript_22313/g.35572  ORF Transcript_22313/g.35572 Transcript_22313/m.35572 type:complete len:137 (+) Transcript_22313:4825-5235(+)
MTGAGLPHPAASFRGAREGLWMTHLNRRMVFGGVAALGLFSGAAWAQDLSGSYTAEGRNPDGSAYTGEVQMTQSADVISMAWRVGSSSYIGTGVRAGRVLTIDWGQATPVVYVVMSDGSLHGTWADGLGLERLTPQ